MKFKGNNSVCMVWAWAQLNLSDHHTGSAFFRCPFAHMQPYLKRTFQLALVKRIESSLDHVRSKALSRLGCKCKCREILRYKTTSSLVTHSESSIFGFFSGPIVTCCGSPSRTYSPSISFLSSLLSFVFYRELLSLSDHLNQAHYDSRRVREPSDRFISLNRSNIRHINRMAL